MLRRQDLLARFWAKCDRSAGLLACWPWLGAFNTPAGRGSKRAIFWVAKFKQANGRYSHVFVYAPRFALSITDGVPLSDRTGLQARHLCAAPEGNCCNPVHLEWGTDAENREDRFREARRDQPTRVRDFGAFC